MIIMIQLFYDVNMCCDRKKANKENFVQKYEN